MDDKPDMLRRVLVTLVLISLVVFALTFFLKTNSGADVSIELPELTSYDNVFGLDTIISGTHSGFSAEVLNANLTLTFSDAGNSIFVNEDTLRIKDSGEVSMQLVDYTGSLSFKDTMTFDGITSSIVVNGVELSPSAQVNVHSEGLSVNSLEIDRVHIDHITLTGGGTITSDNVVYTADSEVITFRGYSGSFIQGDTVSLSGSVSMIEVEGETTFTLR